MASEAYNFWIWREDFMSHDVFISYASNDKQIVTWICILYGVK